MGRTVMAKKFISDAEMEKLSPSKKKFISDDEMMKIEGSAKQPKSYDYSNAPKDLLKAATSPQAFEQYGQAIGEVVGLGNPAISGAGQAAGRSVGQAVEGVVSAVQDPQKFISDLSRLPTKEQVLDEVGKYLNAFSEGAVSTKVGQVVGNVANKAISSTAGKLAEKAKSSAQFMGAKAIGAERGTIKKIGADETKEIGQYAIDNLLKPFSDTQDIIAANAAKKKLAGESMGEVYSKIDDVGKSSFNPLEVATDVEKQLAPAYRTPINKSEVTQFENTLESILARGDKNIPLKQAQALKEEIGAVAYPKGIRPKEPTPKQQMAMDAYRIVNTAIDEATSKGAAEIGSESLSNILKESKKAYSMAKGADKFLENKLAREEGNKLVSLTDWSLLGGGGLASVATGGAAIPVTAIAYAAKKYGEKFGAQQSALTLNSISKFLANSKEFSKVDPKVLSTFANQVYQSIKSEYKAQKPTEPLNKKQEPTEPQKPSASFPLKVNKNGYIAFVQNDKDLKEALGEGWNV